MVSDQLISYVKEQLAQGFSPQEIKNALVQSGWDRINVEDALREVEREGAQQAAREKMNTFAHTLRPLTPFTRALKRAVILVIVILVVASIAAFLFF